MAAGPVVDGEQPDLVLNDDIVRAAGLTEAEIVSLAREQLQEIERSRVQYMLDRAPVSARGYTAILVDGGVATGASMDAAIQAIRRRAPLRVLVAVPVPSLAAATGRSNLTESISWKKRKPTARLN
jgi:putative phosphoribosyl transferase